MSGYIVIIGNEVLNYESFRFFEVEQDANDFAEEKLAQGHGWAWVVAATQFGSRP